MSFTEVRTHAPRWIRRAVVLTVLLAMLLTALAGTANAHGNVSDPPSRLYHCFHNTDRFDPDLATTDPMCAQAWEAEPQALYDWMAHLRTEGDRPYEEYIPDGEICSAGLDKYAAFDRPGNWKATEVDNTFTLTYEQTAPHETEFYWVYVTRQGFDPTTDELTWDDLELVHETGQLPAAQQDQFEVSAPGRTGRHIVFVIWRRLPSHSPESFFSCSDVIFPGDDGDEGTPGGDDSSEEPGDDSSAPASEEPSEDATGEPGGDDTGQPGDDSGEEPSESATDEPGDAGAAETPEEPPDEGGFDFSGFLEWLLTLLNGLFGLFD